MIGRKNDWVVSMPLRLGRYSIHPVGEPGITVGFSDGFSYLHCLVSDPVE